MDPQAAAAAAAQMTVAEFCAEEQQLHRRPRRPHVLPPIDPAAAAFLTREEGTQAEREAAQAGSARIAQRQIHRHGKLCNIFILRARAGGERNFNFAATGLRGAPPPPPPPPPPRSPVATLRNDDDDAATFGAAIVRGRTEEEEEGESPSSSRGAASNNS